MDRRRIVRNKEAALSEIRSHVVGSFNIASGTLKGIKEDYRFPRMKQLIDDFMITSSEFRSAIRERLKEYYENEYTVFGSNEKGWKGKTPLVQHIEPMVSDLEEYVMSLRI